MHYFFASESLGPMTELIAQITEALGGDGPLEEYRSVERLLERLRRHNGPGVVILLAANHQDLEHLSARRDVVLDADVILLVADDEAATLAAAHSLRPSFLGRTDCDLDRIVPVLIRLLTKRARRRELRRTPKT